MSKKKKAPKKDNPKGKAPRTPPAPTFKGELPTASKPIQIELEHDGIAHVTLWVNGKGKGKHLALYIEGFEIGMSEREVRKGIQAFLDTFEDLGLLTSWSITP